MDKPQTAAERVSTRCGPVGCGGQATPWPRNIYPIQARVRPQTPPSNQLLRPSPRFPPCHFWPNRWILARPELKISADALYHGVLQRISSLILIGDVQSAPTRTITRLPVKFARARRGRFHGTAAERRVFPATAEALGNDAKPYERTWVRTRWLVPPQGSLEVVNLARGQPIQS